MRHIYVDPVRSRVVRASRVVERHWKDSLLAGKCRLCRRDGPGCNWSWCADRHRLPRTACVCAYEELRSTDIPSSQRAVTLTAEGHPVVPNAEHLTIRCGARQCANWRPASPSVGG